MTPRLPDGASETRRKPVRQPELPASPYKEFGQFSRKV
jgi:hypothetical protein